MFLNEPQSDFAIIGAGIIGLSIAHALAREVSPSIVVFEKDSIGSGASGVAPGGVRRQWATDVNCAMSSESLAFYRQIDEALEPDTDLIFRECGYLFLAHSQAMLQELQLAVERQNRFSIPSRIVSPQDLPAILPALRTDSILGASYCSEDGYFDDPWGVVYAFARAARRLRVQIAKGEVIELRADGSGWQLRFADGSTARAQQVIIAAGSDSAKLVRPLGVAVPIEAELRYLYFSEPVSKRICDPLVISNECQFAVKQLADGQFLTSYLGAGRNEAEPQPEAWQAHIAESAEEILPALLDLRLTHLVKGTYDMTPDHQPIVGQIPDMSGLWLAAGLSGHGFMMAPAVAQAVADLVSDREPAWYFTGLGLERFAGQHLLPEAQVI